MQQGLTIESKKVAAAGDALYFQTQRIPINLVFSAPDRLARATACEICRRGEMGVPPTEVKILDELEYKPGSTPIEAWASYAAETVMTQCIVRIDSSTKNFIVVGNNLPQLALSLIDHIQAHGDIGRATQKISDLTLEEADRFCIEIRNGNLSGPFIYRAPKKGEIPPAPELQGI
jgi:hypothetical protein